MIFFLLKIGQKALWHIVIFIQQIVLFLQIVELLNKKGNSDRILPLAPFMPKLLLLIFNRPTDLLEVRSY